MVKFNYDKSITSRDVAKLAGVSQSTVSRVYTKSAKVKEEVRQKVLQAAEQLGYHPNFMARGMVSGKTNIVGIVVGEGMGPFYNRILNLLITKLQAFGKQPLLFKVSERDDINNIVLKVAQFQVDFIIITAPAIKKDITDFELVTDIPIILFNRFIDNDQLHMVYTDSFVGSKLAAKLLCEHGHRNIGYIRFEKETEEEEIKFKGFQETLAEFRLELGHVEYADYSYTAGYDACLRMFQKMEKDRPTALFCTSDLMAIGAMDALRDRYQLQVPRDISIIGYDDIDMSRWTSYNLTTVRQPYDYLVDETIRLMEQKEQEKDSNLQILKRVEPQLIVRNSVQKNRKT